MDVSLFLGVLNGLFMVMSVLFGGLRILWFMLILGV